MTRDTGAGANRITFFVAADWSGGEADHFRDEADYVAHVRYYHMNPVKHGFVERAVDWPYSSIHRDIARGIVEPEWSGVITDGAFGE